MDLGLADKRVMISGATKGIGKATAKVFAEEGARVAVTYHTNKKAADELVEELGPDRACAVYYDLGDPGSIIAAVRAVEELWGGIDVLVANAQTWVWTNEVTPFEDLSTAEWNTKLQENFVGHAITIQHAIGGMHKRDWGRIALLGSVTATHGVPGSEIYGASKSAMFGFVRGLMWGRGGVLANVVVPGATLTESLQNVDPAIIAQQEDLTPSGRLSTPQDIAKVVVFLCSEANGNITGEVVHTAGGR
jgi:3-oxoacyl-[acyl-carrier protein] reductase